MKMPDINKPETPIDKLRKLKVEYENVGDRIRNLNDFSDIPEIQALGRRAGELKQQISCLERDINPRPDY